MLFMSDIEIATFRRPRRVSSVTRRKISVALRDYYRRQGGGKKLGGSKAIEAAGNMNILSDYLASKAKTRAEKAAILQEGDRLREKLTNYPGKVKLQYDYSSGERQPLKDYSPAALPKPDREAVRRYGKEQFKAFGYGLAPANPRKPPEGYTQRGRSIISTYAPNGKKYSYLHEVIINPTTGHQLVPRVRTLQGGKLIYDPRPYD